MTFIKRKGRATFSVGKRGPRVSYRMGCALPAILTVLAVAAAVAACQPQTTDPAQRPVSEEASTPTEAASTTGAIPGDPVLDQLAAMTDCIELADWERATLEAYNTADNNGATVAVAAYLARLTVIHTRQAELSCPQ